MDTFSGRPNRPTSQRDVSAQPAQRPVAAQGQAAGLAHGGGGRKKQRMRMVALAIVGILIAGVLVWGVNTVFGIFGNNSIESNKYQAVFLSNGQVYFGKLTAPNDRYYVLTNVYYLQAAVKTADASNPQQTTAQGTGDVQLIKLGKEVHGPEDKMVIEKGQVLFYENLTSDGKVSQSITKYASSQK